MSSNEQGHAQPGVTDEERAESVRNNRVPRDGRLPDGIERVSLRDSSFQRWSDEDVWKLVSCIYDMPETAIDEGMYWHNAMQGTALLMAAVHALAQELSDMHSDCGNDTRPALVEQVIEMTLQRSDEIKEAVARALF